VKRYVVAALCILTAAAGFASGAREDESFSYSGIEKVQVRADFLDVEIRSEDGSSASMRSDLPQASFFEQRNFTVKHEVNGPDLRIWVEKEGILGPRRGGTLFLRVPRRAELAAETTSGTLRIAGSSTRQVLAHTVSGDLLLRDIEASVEAKTISGTLEARRLRGESSLSSVSGRLILRDLRGSCEATSVSGNIDAQDILLEREGRFKTVSGDISVNLRNDLDQMRYELSTVSGALTVGTVSAARGLRMGNGPVLLRGETISGSQSYR
jgi:DUF4097 and DUF4098 domain-containing protein YvlB